MSDNRGSTVKELKAESRNGVTSVDRFAAVAFEALEEVIRKQLDEQINLIGFKIIRGNPVDGEAVLDFFDVVLHAAALIVEAPQIKRFPNEVGDNGFVTPVRVEQQARLSVFDHLRFANNGYTARLFPGSRLVDDRNAFNDPFFIDIAFPPRTGGHLIGQALRPLQLTDIADLLVFPCAVEVFAAKAFVEACIFHWPLAKKFERLG